MEYTILTPNKATYDVVSAAIECTCLEVDTGIDYNTLPLSYIFISLCDMSADLVQFLVKKGYKEIRILRECDSVVPELPEGDYSSVRYFSIEEFHEYVPFPKTYLHVYVSDILLRNQFCCYKPHTAVTENTFEELRTGIELNDKEFGPTIREIFNSWNGFSALEEYINNGRSVLKYQRKQMLHGKLTKLYGGVYKLVPGELPKYESDYTNCIGYSLESSTHINLEFYSHVFGCVRDVFIDYKVETIEDRCIITLPIDHLPNILNFTLDDIVYTEINGSSVQAHP